MARLHDLLPFLQSMRLYYKEILLSLLLNLVAIVALVGLSGLSGGLIIACALASTTPGALEFFHLVTPVGAIRLLAIGRTVGRWAERVVSHDATFRILSELRTWLYTRFSRLSPRQLGNWQSGELLTRVMADIDALDNLLLRVLLPIAMVVVLLTIFGIVATLLAVELGIIVITFVFIYGLILVLSYQQGKKIAPLAIQKRSVLNQEFLNALDLLENDDLDELSWKLRCQTISHQNQDWINQQKKLKRHFSILRAILLTFCGLCLGALIFEAALLSQRPSSSWKEEAWMLALFFALRAMIDVLMTLPGSFLELSGTALSAKRLSLLAQQEPHPSFDQNQPIPDRFDLQLQSVRFSYQIGQPIIQGLSFSLPEKTHMALLGPSGGGKTTLCRLLTRQEDPLEGQILLGGIPLNAFQEEALRQTIVGSLQTPWLMRATLADNLRLACPHATEAELWTVLETVGLKSTVEFWQDGLETWLEEEGENLSGGQRKRIDVARCLLKKAPLTILDEPTEGLSESEALALVQAVRKTLKDHSLLWITHRNHELQDFDLCLTLHQTY